jgi:hypothetical protein
MTFDFSGGVWNKAVSENWELVIENWSLAIGNHLPDHPTAI